jgi:HEAT repeat protein
MGKKAATNEVITKLVSALGDQSHSVRWNACEALGKIGEKAATNEVITKLVTALGDQRDDVREYACKALGKMGDKAATNEVITKLVSVLADQSNYVRWNACEALRKMGEKAATNEVISQLVVVINNDKGYSCFDVATAVESISGSLAVGEQLAQKIVAEYCLCRHASICLKKISEDELINVYLITKNPNLLPTLFQLILWRGAAITAIENKILVYGKTEPVELHIPTLVLRQQLIDAFTDQRKRLHLSS